MRQLLFGRLGTRWGWPAVKADSSRSADTGAAATSIFWGSFTAGRSGHLDSPSNLPERVACSGTCGRVSGM